MRQKVPVRGVLKLVLLLGILGLVVQCRKKPVETNWSYQISKTKHAYLANLKSTTAKQLDDVETYVESAISFVQDPSPFKFGIARGNWRSSWNSYNVWKPFKDIFERISQVAWIDLARIEERSINEAYIDYTTQFPNGGIVMDTIAYPVIDFFAFDAWNTSGPKENRTIGYQVHEYLLFGEDLSFQTSGMRPSSDFSAGTVFTERRRRFYQFSTAYFAEEFDKVELSNKIDEIILKSDDHSFMNHLLGGLIAFIETDFAEQTVHAPYLSQDPNDELSRFSDNTLSDIQMKFKALQIAFYGGELYNQTNGYFLGDLILEVKPSSAETIDVSMKEIQMALSTLINPFDVAIQDPTDRIQLDKIRTELNRIAQELKTFSAIFE